MTKEELKNKKIAYISLGCDKNRVDLEKMLYQIEKFGISYTSELENADIVLINTCAFIMPAREESIENILSIVNLKKQGKIEKIIVSGCLSQRYKKDLYEQIPEVDLFLDLKETSNIVSYIGKLYNIGIIQEDVSYRKQFLTTPKHYAYLKIADGCNNGCAYCTIPAIRGRYVSSPFEEIIKTAQDLAKNGVKEIIVVAQDVTRYGQDLYKKYRLVELLEELSKIKGIEWIRLHYLYPELVSDELLSLVSKNKKICKYLDIPFQHIDEKILKSMNRKSTEETIRNLVHNIKENYPEIVIRSTFIVGLPGESRARFKKLCEFLKEAKLNNVGFFPYYREEYTKAYYMKKQVPNFIKKSRLKKVQKIQEEIANELNLQLMNSVQKVLIDEFDITTGNFLGRTQFNSPNVDYYVIIPQTDNKLVEIGSFVQVKFTEYSNYSFKGEIL